jgi:hypothetical protein
MSPHESLVGIGQILNSTLMNQFCNAYRRSAFQGIAAFCQKIHR